MPPHISMLAHVCKHTFIDTFLYLKVNILLTCQNPSFMHVDMCRTLPSAALTNLIECCNLIREERVSKCRGHYSKGHLSGRRQKQMGIRVIT